MYITTMKSGNFWHVLYYEDRKGRSDVYEYIESRSDRERAKILALLHLLEKQGPQLPRPYADLLTDGIHELRIKISGTQVRILYFFCYREYIILTNSFIKNTEKVPHPEIKKARKLRNDFIQRYTIESLRKILDENA